MTKEAIIAKVQKLLALSKSSNANEAASAAAAADKLIQEHRLAEAELHADKPEEPASGGHIHFEKRRTVWRGRLAGTLAKHYGVYAVVWQTNAGHETRVWGTPGDLELMKYMYAWLSAEALRLVETSGAKGRTARNSWLLGFVSGVAAQLAASKATSDAQARSAGRSAALVLVASAQERARALALHGGGVKVTKAAASGARVDRDAFDSGKRTGASMHLGKAMAERPTRLLGGGS